MLSLYEHMKGHKQKDRKYCHYYNNRKFCAFEELGCKFRHENAGTCSLGKLCQEYMCQFDHVAPSDKENENSDTSGNILEIESYFTTSTPKKPDNDCSRCDGDKECYRCEVKQRLGEHWESFAKNFDQYI